MGDVVEEEPRDRKGPEVVLRGGARWRLNRQRGVIWLVSPRDEGTVATVPAEACVRAVLRLAKRSKMLNPVFQGVKMPEHHGAGRPEALAVCLVHDFDPEGRTVLQRADCLFDALSQDLGATAWKAVETGCLEPSKCFRNRQARISCNMVDLRWREAMQGNCVPRLD